MKTEWTQEPHTTVRWAIFEALRGADKASTVDYWDVVTENLIQGLGLREKYEALARVSELAEKWGNATDLVHGGIHPVATAFAAEVTAALGDWKRGESDD